MITTLKTLKGHNTTRSTEEGFTLLELLIVIVIIGILTAIAIPIFATAQKSAITATVKSDVKNMVDYITPRILAQNSRFLLHNLSCDEKNCSAQLLSYNGGPATENGGGTFPIDMSQAVMSPGNAMISIVNDPRGGYVLCGFHPGSSQFDVVVYNSLTSKITTLYDQTSIGMACSQQASKM